jgi:nucleoside-diphosphate-sugar epimerase
MSQARYLVTGGAGFIGSNIVAALVKSGERVRAYDNLFTGRWGLVERLLPGRGEVERITADIRDGEALTRAMQGVEVVFHEAADGSVPRSIENPVQADSINIQGTVSVLDCARRAGVKRVLFAASSAAYGDDPALPKREDMSPDPLSPYAVTKLAGESYMRVFSSLYGIETLSLRYFNVFGPNQLPDGAYAAAIPKFAHAALRGETIKVFGDGEQTRDFCFIDNVVAANLAGATTPRRLSGEVANIAGARRISLNALIEELGRVLGKKLEVEHLATRQGDVRHSLADIGRARELIGFEPRATWEQGLPSTIEFLREYIEKGVA